MLTRNPGSLAAEKLALKASSNRVFEKLKKSTVDLNGKFYLGKSVLYLFEKEGFEVFEIKDLLESFSVINLDDEELSFISENFFGKHYSSDIVKGFLSTPSGVSVALIGIINTLYGSVLTGLSEICGDMPVSDILVERLFIQSEFSSTA